MAKDKKQKDPEAVATATTAPDALGDVVNETAPDAGPRPAAPRPATPRAPSAPPRPADPQRSPADVAVSAVSDVVHVVQSVLPNRTPAYLGGAALLVLGIVDLPAVAGGALAYEAVRRWGPASRR